MPSPGWLSFGFGYTAAIPIFSINGATRAVDDDWAVGQVGDAPDAQPILEAPPILSATIEPTPSRGLRLLSREDVTVGSRVSISWTGRDWFDVQRGDHVRLKDDENPTALNVRGEKDRTWVLPVVDAPVTKNLHL